MCFISEYIHITSPTSLLIASAVIVIAVIHYFLKTKDLPPGPIGLPFLGYWPFINSETCHLQLQDLQKKYGDVFGFSSAGRLYVNLGSFKSIREAYVTNAECFENRINEYHLFATIFEESITFANGEPWKIFRKFFIQILKERGVITMKGETSGALSDSIRTTVGELRSKIGKPVNIIELFTDRCTAVMRKMCFGDYGMTHDEILEVNEHYGNALMFCVPANILLSGNFAKYFVFPFIPGYRDFLKHQKKLEASLYRVIQKHKDTYDEEHVRDIIDEYLKEKKLRQKKGDPTAAYFTDKSLMTSLIQFVGDGVITDATFACVILQILLDHPEEQEKIYHEIVEVVGLDRHPTAEDKNRLTYTSAFLLEAFRTANFFSLIPSRVCSKETTVGGYKIPVGAIALTNSWNAHMDPEVYEEPEKFNPSRYVPKDGRKRPELPISFGAGKRACIGESFAVMEVFLFLTMIVQNFRISLPKGIEIALFDDLITGKLRVYFEPRIPT